MKKSSFGLDFILCLSIFLILYTKVYCQDSTARFFDQPTKKFVMYTGATYAVSMVGLNQLWYKDYERSSFHVFNDNDEWLQMDKVGHLYSAYTLTNLSTNLLSGVSDPSKKALLSGTATFLFLSTVEVFDGFSKEWGFSWGDMIGNAAGIGLFTAQEMIFNKQYVRLKYSYHNSDYRAQRPELLGENTLQAAFKDYNGQTYWASINLNNLHKNVQPKWLNFAFGYSGEGMISASNHGLGESNNGLVYRQYFFSLDVDFEKISTKSKILKKVFKVANCIKVPFPAVELNSDFDSKFNWFYF